MSAQRQCGTPDYAAKMPYIHHASSPFAARIARDTLNDELIIIPVVVHVLYHAASESISDAQILSQIESLNRDFGHLNDDAVNTPEAFRGLSADCRIRFCLAHVDPAGRLTGGVIRKFTSKEYFLTDDGMKFSAAGGDDAWDSRRYLNLWVCNMSGRSLGYASPPGGPEATDGVVINFDVFGNTGVLRAPFNKGRTATHEIGHWLGLKHIWGDQLCGSDDVDDTPPQRSYNYGCPSYPRISACSVGSSGDMFMNFMDFSDDGCMNMFTVGQKARMRSCFALNADRNGFLDSDACDSSAATSGAPESNIPAVPPASVSEFLTVQPNPAHDVITVKGMGSLVVSGMHLDVLNGFGQKIMQHDCLLNSETLQISGLPAGQYLIRCNKGKKREYVRFIKL
jgi:hypothetical protein